MSSPQTGPSLPPSASGPGLSYWSDVLASAAITGGVALARRRGWISRTTARAFVAGSAVGATWEVGFHLLGPHSPWARHRAAPMYDNLTPFPLPARLQPLVHSLWDGGLFLAGLGLVRLLPGDRDPAVFRASDLAVMTAWGTAQELAVELAFNGTLWQYHPRSYNPVLFRVGERELTALPHLVWLVAPAAFHAALLALARAERRTALR